MKKRKELVKQLTDLITKGNAHATFEDAITKVPPAVRSKVPAKLPYSIWQLVEHMRIAQWDIVEFCRNPKHKSPKWPEGYWPIAPAPADDEAWHNSIEQIRRDQADFLALLEDKDADLYEPLAHGDGQNLLREALLIADHNSYHTAEIIVLRRLQGDWK